MTIRINIDKAKEIQRNRWRALRGPKLAALDVIFMRALENGDTGLQAAIVASKTALRDVTATPFPSDEPEAIASFFPDCLS